MLDFSWQNIIHSNLINFIIMAAIIVWLCLKLNVAEKLENFRTVIEKKVTKSDEEKQTAHNFLKTTEKSIENLGQELEQIKQNAQKSAQNLANKIITDTHKQIDKLEQTTQKNIGNQIAKVQEELLQEITETTLLQAKEQIEQKLQTDTNLHKKLIDESIENLDKAQI